MIGPIAEFPHRRASFITQFDSAAGGAEQVHRVPFPTLERVCCQSQGPIEV